MDNIQPRCAICGGPPFPECPHERERLELALHQAQERWSGVQRIRDWVLNHARNHVLHLFERAKQARWDAHVAYLQTLPYYSLWQYHRGNPPLPPREIDYLAGQLRNAEYNLTVGVDADWRKACLMYPEMLDYFFSLVDLRFPDDGHDTIRRPQVEKGRIRRDSGVSDKGTGKRGRVKG